MSENPSAPLRRAWREALSRRESSLIRPEDREANEREYRVTHGYEPETGTWLVPRRWHPPSAQVLGKIEFVEYISRKDFEGLERYIFHHDHEIDHRPFLASGVNEYDEVAYMILGGGYKVTPHGIEDDEVDPRDIPDLPAFRVPRELPANLTGMGKMFSFRLTDKTGAQRTLDLSRAGLVLGYVRKPRSRLYTCPDR